MKVGSSADNAVLELYYYRGQWQLATFDALYSDGSRYRPLLVAYKHLNKKLAAIDEVLVLGTGLGSAVQIMHKMGYRPNFTLVDIDKLVLQWALEILPIRPPQQIKPVCADACQFVGTLSSSVYNLIILDVFIGRVVPSFVTEQAFLQKCRQAIKPGGSLILNYIVNDEKEWEKLKAVLADVFPRYELINLGINRVVITTV